MKLGALFSGGKDSCAALEIARSYGHEVSCLISVKSENTASFMFHTPNISWTKEQAKAASIPLIEWPTSGVKEKELEDLKSAVDKAKKEFAIKGIITGAILSTYQATRVQKICYQLGLWCFNPLWQRDQREYVEWLIKSGIKAQISAIAAYPLNKSWLSKPINNQFLEDISKLDSKFHIGPAGEGGEFETVVTSCPSWPNKLIISGTKKMSSDSENAGVFEIADCTIQKKSQEEIKQVPIENWRVQEQATNNTEHKVQEQRKTDILIISCCSESLSEEEFVRPLVNICSKAGKNTTITPYDKVDIKKVNNFDKVIISGTALIDDEFLKEHEKSFSWLKSYEGSVFGICSGFQILKLFSGYKKSEDKLEIELKKLDNKQQLETPYGNCDQIYLLHHNNFTQPENASQQENEYYFHNKQKKWFGTLFHPEVRNEELLKNWLKEQ